MKYLKPIPRSSERQAPARAVTVVSADSRGVVYLEDEASLEIITAALKAWGLKVRSEREVVAATAKALPPVATAEACWETTRPRTAAPGRLDNVLSPLWLPIRQPVAGNEPVAAWGWFGRAA
jgi:hypothetical protein